MKYLIGAMRIGCGFAAGMYTYNGQYLWATVTIICGILLGGLGKT